MRQLARLAAGDIDLEDSIGRGVGELLRAGCPRDVALLGRVFCQALARARRDVEDPHLLVSRFVRDIRDLAPIRRVHLAAIAPRRARHLHLLADSGLRRHDHDLAVEVHRHILAARRDAEPLGAILRRHDVDIVFLRIERHRHRDLPRLAGGNVDLPEIEVILIDDSPPVRRDGGKEHAALFMKGDLLRCSALRRDAPDIEDAVALRGVVDVAVGAPHWKHFIHVILEVPHVGIGDLRDLARSQIADDDVRAGVAAIFLAPWRHQVAVERDQRRVLLHHAGAREAHGHRRRRRTVERKQIQRRSEGVRTAAARDHDLAPIGRPVERLVVAGVVRELPWLSASHGNDVDVVISHPVAGEGDPLPVGGKARRKVARGVTRQPARVATVGVREPDVILIREGDRAVVRDMRKARELDRLGLLGQHVRW